MGKPIWIIEGHFVVKTEIFTIIIGFYHKIKHKTLKHWSNDSWTNSRPYVLCQWTWDKRNILQVENIELTTLKCSCKSKCKIENFRKNLTIISRLVRQVNTKVTKLCMISEITSTMPITLFFTSQIISLTKWPVKWKLPANTLLWSC